MIRTLITLAFIGALIAYVFNIGFWVACAWMLGAATAILILIAGVRFLFELLRDMAAPKPHIELTVTTTRSDQPQTPFGGGGTRAQMRGMIESHGGRARDDVPNDSFCNVRNARIGIEYRSGLGVDSERYIVPSSFKYRTARDGRIFITDIEAFCELRHDHRSFKYHRVKTAFDAETGEIINNFGEFLWTHRDDW